MSDRSKDETLSTLEPSTSTETEESSRKVSNMVYVVKEKLVKQNVIRIRIFIHYDICNFNKAI